MGDSLFLAWQYLRHNRVTTVVLVVSITLILYLPVGLQVIVHNAEQHFRSRADSTPLLVGPRGSSLELVLAGLYFDKPYDAVMSFKELRRIEKQDLGKVIPLHTKFTARDHRIVGTSAGYLNLRGMRLTEGTIWGMLGECVIGARAAKRLNLQVGDKIPVSSSTAFVLDNPPLRLRVVGVLAPNETPDDEVIFVNLKTTWIIEGLGHGHAQGAKHGSPEAELYTDITKENVSSIHFHGSFDKFPITAVIAIPGSDKAETILLGQYFSSEETVQIVQPSEVMDGLLEKIVMIRSYMIAVIALISLVTLLTITLVFVLSIRLRRAEMMTMSKMGCSRYKIASILGSQITIILAVSAIIASILAVATNVYSPLLVRLFIL